MLANISLCLGNIRRVAILIVNSQASFQVAKEIRGLFGKIRNNLSFKKFLCFYRIEGRTITLSEGRY